MVSKHFFQYCSRSSIFIGSYDKPKYSSNVYVKYFSKYSDPFCSYKAISFLFPPCLESNLIQKILFQILQLILLTLPLRSVFCILSQKHSNHHKRPFQATIKNYVPFFSRVIRIQVSTWDEFINLMS